MKNLLFSSLLFSSLLFSSFGYAFEKDVSTLSKPFLEINRSENPPVFKVSNKDLLKLKLDIKLRTFDAQNQLKMVPYYSKDFQNEIENFKIKDIYLNKEVYACSLIPYVDDQLCESLKSNEVWLDNRIKDHNQKKLNIVIRPTGKIKNMYTTGDVFHLTLWFNPPYKFWHEGKEYFPGMEGFEEAIKRYFIKIRTYSHGSYEGWNVRYAKYSHLDKRGNPVFEYTLLPEDMCHLGMMLDSMKEFLLFYDTGEKFLPVDIEGGTGIQFA